MENKSVKRSALVLILTVLGVFIVIGAIFKVEFDLLRQKELEAYRIEATKLADFFQSSLEVTTAKISGAAGFLEASQQVTELELQQFVQRSDFFGEGAHLRAIAIMPVVDPENAAAFNTALRDRLGERLVLGYPDWRGIDVGRSEPSIPATYVEPEASRAGVVGFDLTTSSERMEAAEIAKTSRRIAMTKPVQLSQDASQTGRSVLLLTYSDKVRLGLSSVYDADGTPTYIAVSYTPAIHISSLMSKNPTGLETRVLDVTDAGSPIQVYADDKVAGAELIRSSELTFASRTWRVESYASLSDATSLPGWLYAFLTLSIVLTALLAMGALRLIMSEARLAQRVKERTAELTERNITLANAQQATAEALRRAEKANKMKSEFLAMMSHEFRTPLNAIIGFTQMIRLRESTGVDDEKEEEYLNDIYTSGALMLDLVNDILDAAALEIGRRELTPERFQLVDEIEDIVGSLGSLAQARQIEILTRIENDPAEVVFDRLVLRQILINLLSNAIKFSPASSTVIVESVKHRGGLRFSVLDRGPGIPSAALETITMPFTRVSNDPMVSREGAGLGLAIVKGLIDLVQGELRFDSRDGGGTAVTVVLPHQQNAKPS